MKQPLGIATILYLQTTLIYAKITDKYATMPELFHVDDFDRCMLHGDEALYCDINVELFPKNPENYSDVWETIEDISDNPYNYNHKLLRYKICVPEMVGNFSKLDIDLTEFYDNKFENKGLKTEVRTMRCETQNSQFPVDIYDTIFGILFLFYCLAIIYATFHEAIFRKDVIQNKSNEKFFWKLISALSLRKNWNQLTTVDLTTKDMQSLSCIQGVRFYNMLWVINIHTVLIVVASYSLNPQYLEMTSKDDFTTALTDSTLAMQNFFMVSTWLLTYNFFKDMEKRKGVTLGYMVRQIIKRYFRLTPTMAFMVALYGTWFVHISRGPFWDNFVAGEYTRCRANWWLNLLYINNFINEKSMCFLHGWYLTVNMQYYIMGLVLTWIMWKFQKWVPLILGSGWLIHVLLSFRIFYWNSYKFAIRFTPETLLLVKMLPLDQFHTVYISLITNFASVIAGLTYGYVLFQNRDRPLFTTKIRVTLWWVLTHVVNSTMILLPSIVKIDPEINPWVNAIYGSLWRSMFVFSSGMIILGMCQGKGGFLKWACESSLVYILGRLTFTAYLVHPLFQYVRAGMKRTPNYVSLKVIFFEYFEDLSLAFFGALVLTLLIELPAAQLYKLMTEKKDTENDSDNTNNTKYKLL